MDHPRAHSASPGTQGRGAFAELFTDFPARFAEHPHVQLAPAGFAEADSQGGPAQRCNPLEIVSHWLPTGRNAGRVVLHFAGVDSITQAEALAGKEVIVPLEERMPLEEGAVYVADLIGRTVIDRDAVLGVVDSIDFPTTPDGSRRLEEAAPLLSVLTPEGDEVLVPFVKSYLVAIDHAATRTIRMDLPQGLADLNRSTSTDKPAGGYKGSGRLS